MRISGGATHRLKSVPPGSLCYLDEFQAREKIVDFKGGGFGGVRAVRAIVADAGAEVVANRAGSGFLGIGGAHRVAPLQNGAFGFEDQDENFTGAHELTEFAEKGAGFVNGVKTSGFASRKNHGLDGNDAKTGLVNA